jgi:hypothetical protein
VPNAETRRQTALTVIRKVVRDQTEIVAVSKGIAIIVRNTGTKRLIVKPRRKSMREQANNAIGGKNDEEVIFVALEGVGSCYQILNIRSFVFKIPWRALGLHIC